MSLPGAMLNPKVRCEHRHLQSEPCPVEHKYFCSLAKISIRSLLAVLSHRPKFFHFLFSLRNMSELSFTKKLLFKNYQYTFSRVDRRCIRMKGSAGNEFVADITKHHGNVLLCYCYCSIAPKVQPSVRKFHATISAVAVSWSR